MRQKPMSPTTPATEPAEPKEAPAGRLFRLPLPDSDAGLVAAVRSGRPDAHEELVRRCGGDVERVLFRVLGPDSEMEDLAHEVFIAAFACMEQLREPKALRSWLVGIAVRKARKLIARRKRWSFVRNVAPGDLPEREASTSNAEITEAFRSTYRLMGELPVDDRIAFALRYVDGMELTAVAAATEVSLATAKRRVARARVRFLQLAQKNEVLASWVTDEEVEA
jgi:RNA polymerase sigma-70 factor (ECF subfamily)